MLTTKEAAALMNVTESWVRRLLREKRLKGELRNERRGQYWMVDEADAERYKAAGYKRGPKGPHTKE